MKNKSINTFEINEYWSDIGTLEQYKISTNDIFSNKCTFNHTDIIKTQQGAYISETKNIDETVQFIGNSTIGHNCSIGKNVVIENCIIWDNVKISDNLCLKNSIIASNCSIYTDLNNQILGANQALEIVKI